MEGLRKHRPQPQEQRTPTKPEALPGPSAPAIDMPDTSGILKKLKSIDREGAKKYRQKSGQ